jgi:hypothetical protein
MLTHITYFVNGLNFSKNKIYVFKAQVIASNVGRQKFARFEVLTLVQLNTEIFWDITPFRQANSY